MLSFTGLWATGLAEYDLDLRDLIVVDTDAGVGIVATTGPSGGLVRYAITDGALPVLVETLAYDSDTALYTSGTASAMVLDSGDFLAMGLASDGALWGYDIAADGGLSLRSTDTPVTAPSSTLSAIAQAPGDSTVLFATTGTTGSILFAAPVDGTASPRTLSADTYLSDIVAVRIGGRDVFVACDLTNDRVISYSTDSGRPEELDSVGASDGLGIDRPTAIDGITAYGARYVIVASNASSTLSVAILSRDGGLEITDHVIDTPLTRFGAVHSITSFISADRAYVAVAGGEDGISLFLLLPNGTLRHSHSIAHDGTNGLADITALAAITTGDSTSLFAASASGMGLAQLRLDTDSTVGDILIAAADTRTKAGDGDDIILISGDDAVVLGRAGADVFRPGAALTSARIADFEPGRDQLDLAELPLLRSVAQITVTPTSKGAIVEYGPLRLVVISAEETALDPDDLLAGALPAADHLLTFGTKLRGSSGRDDLVGALFADTIKGLAGHDTLNGHGGDDRLLGGSGHDRLLGADGNDTIKGGGDNDRLSGGDGDDRLIGQAGNDTVLGGAGDDDLSGNGGDDQIEGGAGHDSLGAGSGSDTVIGGGGHDRIKGGNGRDKLTGSDGDDRIWGNGGADTIKGSGGHDTLTGGKGDDRMIGGKGRDQFVLSKNNGDDVINDFQIALDTLVFDGLRAKHLDFAEQGRHDTLITYSGGSLLLNDISADEWSALSIDFI